METSTRYDAWRGLAAGDFALSRCRSLLRVLLAGWPRRGRSMLAMNAGSDDGMFLESLWEAGFDVTGQDGDRGYLDKARARLGSRADFTLSAPEHLPFDDNSFDYAVAVAAMEFWREPEAVLTEIGRVACGGLILIFPCSWSLFALECRVRAGNPLRGAARPQSPRRVNRLLRRVYGDKKKVWSSVLPGPSASWTHSAKVLNNLRLPLPLGAFAGVRVNFGPLYTATPLLLRRQDSVAALE